MALILMLEMTENLISFSASFPWDTEAIPNSNSFLSNDADMKDLWWQG